MILITASHWFGPSYRGRRPEPLIKPVAELLGLVTELPLGEAIRLIRDYSRKYAELYGEHLAVERGIVGVTYLPEPLSSVEIEEGRLILVETMSARLDAEIEERKNER
jgi:hypothetical protein